MQTKQLLAKLDELFMVALSFDSRTLRCVEEERRATNAVGAQGMSPSTDRH